MPKFTIVTIEEAKKAGADGEPVFLYFYGTFELNPDVTWNKIYPRRVLDLKRRK